MSYLVNVRYMAEALEDVLAEAHSAADIVEAENGLTDFVVHIAEQQGEGRRLELIRHLSECLSVYLQPCYSASAVDGG